MKRRGFLARLVSGASAAAALVLLPRCDSGAGAAGFDELAEPDDLGMHGPIEEATEALQLPAAPTAAALLAPYHDGRPIDGSWAIAHVGRGHQDAVVIVAVDLQTGGHAEFVLLALDGQTRPIAASDRWGVYLDNGARGGQETPRHMRHLAGRIAEIVRSNEPTVEPEWDVPTLAGTGGLLHEPDPARLRFIEADPALAAPARRAL